LSATNGKGLEVSGTFARKNGQLSVELTLTNKSTQPMMRFGIQFNKNSFGLLPTEQLSIQSPLLPKQTIDIDLPLSTNGPVQVMNPLTHLQGTLINNVDAFIFSCMVPIHMLFMEDGVLDEAGFLAMWKDSPAQKEVQYEIKDVQLSLDSIEEKLRKTNIFSVARHNVGGQDTLCQSIKLTNGIYVLGQLKIQPIASNVILTLKTTAGDVIEDIRQVYEWKLH